MPTPRRLLEEAETCAHIAVYAAIAWHRNKTGLAMPGIARIAMLARVSRPTAMIAINWLREHKFLEFSQRDGHRQARAYRFPDLEETGQNEAPVTGQNEIPVNDETGAYSLPVYGETGQNPTLNRSKSGHLTRHTNKKQRKTPPSRDKREPDGRHTQFKEAIGEYWASRNPNVSMPWDASEGKKLCLLLQANPKLTLDAFRNLLRNRYQSEVSHAERPRQWLERATDYALGPLDRYGKPKDSSNGTTANRAQQRTNGNLQALAAARASRATSQAALGMNPDQGHWDDEAEVADIRRRQAAGEQVSPTMAAYADRWERGQEFKQAMEKQIEGNIRVVQ